MDGSGDGPTVKTAMATAAGQVVLSERVVQFRRLYRWFNLTVLQQGAWPLLILLASAPTGKPGELPFAWFLARLAAPALAAATALLYLRHQPETAPRREAAAAPAGRPGLAAQARAGLLMLAALLVVARLIAGPIQPASQLILFGIADVAAFHLIHFGVVRRSYPEEAQGMGMATLLFGLSWGIRDLLLTALGPTEASPAFALLVGVVLGVAVAMASRGLRATLGAFWPGAVVHLIVVYLIIGFTG